MLEGMGRKRAYVQERRCHMSAEADLIGPNCTLLNFARPLIIAYLCYRHYANAMNYRIEKLSSPFSFVSHSQVVTSYSTVLLPWPAILGLKSMYTSSPFLGVHSPLVSL